MISDHLPLVAYFGHHKCGTTWIVSMMASISARIGLRMMRHDQASDFGRDIRAWLRKNPIDFWCFTNADSACVDGLQIQGFHVVRDPRDMLVSAYFSHRNSHSTEGWKELVPHRARLRSRSEERGLFAEMDFMRGVFEQMERWQGAPYIREIRFEDLIRDTSEILTSILTEIGIVPDRIDRRAVEQIVNDHQFSLLSGGRFPGEEDQNHHYRMGVAGDWRNHFTPELAAHFHERHNGLLHKLGYEREENLDFAVA